MEGYVSYVHPVSTACLLNRGAALFTIYGSTAVSTAAARFEFVMKRRKMRERPRRTHTRRGGTRRGANQRAPATRAQTSPDR